MANKQPGLDGRERDDNGRIRSKNGATLLGTIEEKYGVDFGRHGNMKLDNFLKKEGYDSMTQAIKDYQ